MPQANATTTIALDRFPSSRIFDHDGHLHVEQVHITKAGVSPYYGSEIPHAKELGLDPNKIYRLFRDPIELQKAAPTLNNKPLLFGHNPVHAENHDHARTVGTVSKPVWNPPYLDADMACWSGPAIDCIKDDTQKELSSAYHYIPVMESGVFEGEPYEGRMTKISFNHVGLVPKGRVGSDCVVSDSAETVLQHLTAATAAVEQIVAAQDVSDATDGRAGPNQPVGAPMRIIQMAKHSLSGAAAHTQGALSTYLYSKLAQDAQVDIRPLVEGLTAKNFKSRRPVLSLGLKGATVGKLAQDADLSDVEEVLDRVEEAVEELSDTVDEVEPVAATPDPDATTDEGDDLRSKLEAAGVPEDVINKVLAEMNGPATPPAQDAAPKAPDMKNYVSRPAMDAEIARAEKRIEEKHRKLRATEQFCRIHAGELPAMDSEDEYLRATCDVNSIDHRDVPTEGLRPLIEAYAKIKGAAARPARTTVAQDAASRSEAEKLFRI